MKTSHFNPVRLEAIVLTLIILAPLVAILLPAPPIPQLPAPKIAGLLPEPQNFAQTFAQRKISALDDELRQIFQKSLKSALSAKPTYRPLFV